MEAGRIDRKGREHHDGHETIHSQLSFQPYVYLFRCVGDHHTFLCSVPHPDLDPEHPGVDSDEGHLGHDRFYLYCHTSEPGFHSVSGQQRHQCDPCGNGRYFSAGAEEGSGTAWRKEVPFFADTV